MTPVRGDGDQARMRRLPHDTISPAPTGPVAAAVAPTSRAGRAGDGHAWALGAEAAQAGDVQRLRREARGVLSDRWKLDADLADAAELVVCELVANALRHGSLPVELSVRRGAGDTVTVAVSDAGGGIPRLRRVGDEDEDGRGLHLVAAVTRWWTVARHPAGGKTVTAVLAPDAVR